MQNLLVVVIVGLAAFFLGRMFFKSARNGSCPGGCGGCSQSGKCSAYIREEDFSSEEREK